MYVFLRSAARFAALCPNDSRIRGNGPANRELTPERRNASPAGEPPRVSGLGGAVRFVVSPLMAMAMLASPSIAAPADSAPEVEGPVLQQGEPSCEESRVPAGRATAADIHTCLWWFAYAPVLETDVERDHGALWLQTSVDPRPGWCLRRLAGSLYSSPDVTRMHSFTVGGLGSGSRTTLELDAEGAALQPAAISQVAGALPGRFGARPHLDDGSVDFTWRGTTRRRVDAVVGAELSWDSSTSAIEIFEFGRLTYPILARCSSPS